MGTLFIPHVIARPSCRTRSSWPSEKPWGLSCLSMLCPPFTGGSSCFGGQLCPCPRPPVRGVILLRRSSRLAVHVLPALVAGPLPPCRTSGAPRGPRGPAGGAPGGAISSTRRRRAGRDPGERRRRKSTRTGGGYQASFMMWITSSNRARPVAVLAKGARFCLLLVLPSSSPPSHSWKRVPHRG